MYICNCNGITEREIRGAVELGCQSVADLSRDLGLGTCCGKCVPDAHGILRGCGIAAAGSPSHCAAAGD
jgi:bacterioferritin-associated ferredoxin